MASVGAAVGAVVAAGWGAQAASTSEAIARIANKENSFFDMPYSPPKRIVRTCVLIDIQFGWENRKVCGSAFLLFAQDRITKRK
jgi:hypothetical protein